MLSRQLVYVQRGARLKKKTPKQKRKQVKVTLVTKIKYQRYDEGYVIIPHKRRHEDKRRIQKEKKSRLA